jgi:hypothetical protein
MIFNEVADKMRDVSEPLYFQVVLAEIPENVYSHHRSLLNGTRPAIHHRQVIHAVSCADESPF